MNKYCPVILPTWLQIKTSWWACERKRLTFKEKKKICIAFYTQEKYFNGHGNRREAEMTNSSALNQDSVPPECGFSNFLGGQIEINTGAYAILVFAIILHSTTFPFTILLNLLVIMAVKTRRRLQNTSNIAIACLATTDLMVGIIVQPLVVATSILFLLKKTSNGFCTLQTVTFDMGRVLCRASLLHLALMSGERYFAIKYAYSFSTMVTKARTILASGMAYIFSLMLQIPAFVDNSLFAQMSIPVLFAITSLIIFLQFALYRVTRRHEKHVIAHQVTLEARRKLKKEKKALKITRLIMLAVLICYLPLCIARILFFFVPGGKFSPDEGLIMFYLTFSLGVVNSLINPIIYAVRIQSFRRAFFELLCRKNYVEPRETDHEMRVFRQRGIPTYKLCFRELEQGNTGSPNAANLTNTDK